MCFVEGPQLHVNNRLATRGCVLSRVPSCMSTIDSQLKMCVCLSRVPSCKPTIDSQPGGGVCVCLSRAPSCKPTNDSQLGCVCVLFSTLHCKLTIESQLGERCVCMCRGPPVVCYTLTRGVFVCVCFILDT